MNDPERWVQIKGEGDHSAYRRLVPNVVAKTFVATHVKTPSAARLIEEMAVVHSLAEASVQPAGSLAQASAASGTEGAAAALGVTVTPSAALPHGRQMGEVDMIMTLPEAARLRPKRRRAERRALGRPSTS